MVRFGVAGFPIGFTDDHSNSKRYLIFEWLNSLKLNALELQMTYGPRTSKEKCERYSKLSNEYNISLSIHAAYYIVLTSENNKKIRQSIDTLKKTFELSDILGSRVVVLHPGPLYNDSSDKPLNRFIENVNNFFNEIGETDIGLFVETAGKVGQLGSIEDIVTISENVDGCYPCIDFGHVHARTLGTLKDSENIDEMFRKLDNRGIFKDKIHFHYSPIKYGARGEITHKSLDDKTPTPDQLSIGIPEFSNNGGNFYHPRYERIIENIFKYKISGTIISETYNSQEIGAKRMKHHYEELLND